MALSRRSCLLKAANQLVPIFIMCAALAIIFFAMDQQMPGFIVGDINLSYPEQKEVCQFVSSNKNNIYGGVELF